MSTIEKPKCGRMCKSGRPCNRKVGHFGYCVPKRDVDWAQISVLGAKALHAKRLVDPFTDQKFRENSAKGGLTAGRALGENQAHMVEAGRKGGQATQRKRRENAHKSE